jgi:hypothetical protein
MMSDNKTIYNNHLVAFDESGFEMVDGEPDIRNWSVVASENQLVGRVSELIFDKVSHRVLYLVVDINGKPLNLISRRVIVPIGLAEIDRRENLVVVPALTIGHLASLPAYEKGKIAIDTENAVRSIFVRTPGVIDAGQELAYRPNLSEADYPDGLKTGHRVEVKEHDTTTKEEIRKNIIRVKESVHNLEKDLDNLE